jgi:hypothetical protein
VKTGFRLVFIGAAKLATTHDRTEDSYSGDATGEEEDGQTDDHGWIFLFLTIHITTHNFLFCKNRTYASPSSAPISFLEPVIFKQARPSGNGVINHAITDVIFKQILRKGGAEHSLMRPPQF